MDGTAGEGGPGLAAGDSTCGRSCAAVSGTLAQGSACGVGQVGQVDCGEGRRGMGPRLPAVVCKTQGELLAQALLCVLDFRAALAQL